jgi:uncharacterized membrane protein YeaQ/YmgE (transglycosylase-associated protein family)
MTLLELLLLLLIAGTCGGLGQAIAGYRRGGCLVAVALGFIGSLLGRWLASLLDLPEVFAVHLGGRSFPVVWSIAGAAVFVAVLGFFSRKRT